MSITPLNKFLSHISMRDRHRSPRDAASQAQSESGIDFSERVQRKLFSTMQRPSTSVRKRPSIKHLPLVAGPEYGATFPGSPLAPFATHMISPTKTHPPGAFPATPDLSLGSLEELRGSNETTKEREKEKEKEKEDRAKSLRKSVRRSFQSLTQRPSSAPGTRPFDENLITSTIGVSVLARGPAPPRPPRPEERARMAHGLERTSDSIISMTEALSTPPTPTVSTLPPLRKTLTSQTPQTPTRPGSPPMSLRSSLSLSKRSSFPPFVAPSSPIPEHPYEGSPPKSTADGGPWLPPFEPASPGPMIPGAWLYSNSNTTKTVNSQKESPPKLRLKRKPTFSSQAPGSHSPSNHENSPKPASMTAFPSPVLGAFASSGYGSPSKSPSTMTFPEFAPGPLRISEHSSPQNSSVSTFPTPALPLQYGSPLKVSTPIFPSAETPRQGSFSSPKPPFMAQGPKFPERVPNTEELDLWWISLGGKQKMACKEIFETLTGLFDSTYPMLMPNGEEEGEYCGVEEE